MGDNIVCRELSQDLQLTEQLNHIQINAWSKKKKEKHWPTDLCVDIHSPPVPTGIQEMVIGKSLEVFWY